MSFHVRTDALRTCHTELQRLCDDVDAARAYADSYLHVERLHSGIFQNAVQVNDDARAALHEVFARLEEVTRASGVQLHEAARWYDETDAAVAERMDGQLDRVEAAPDADYPGTTPPLEDTVPASPGDYEPPPGIPGDGSQVGTTPGGGGGSW